MVNLVVPVATCDIPERVNGVTARFVVTYVRGFDRSYQGRIGSVWALFKALKARLVRDRSIVDVQVFLPSGRLLCECQRFGR